VKVSSAITKSAGVVAEPAEPELNALLEMSDDAFIVYDASGGIRLAGRRLRQMLDLSESEWANLQDFSSLSRILARHLAECHQQPRPPWLVWHPGNGAGRERLELRGGRSLERVARPIFTDSAQPGGWVERYRDLTAESELPARLFQTEKLAALGQMVAGIAHELNNPLTTVMGYGHLLLERPLDGRALADVRRICQEADRAARVVRSLLMLAREAKLDRLPIHLNEIVEHTVRLCAYDLRRANIAVEVDLAPQLPPALANPSQLQQVVLNLLVNSQQAIAQAGRPGRIALRTRQAADRVFLHVEDDGPGIPTQLQRRIFEPFFTTKPVGVGTGLGLSIVSGILRQHGGEIHVASEPGAGASFSVSLPRAQGRPKSTERQEPENSLPVPECRILVAETEPGVTKLIGDALTGEGHRVELVSDGEEVLRRVRETTYDLIICDWRMPRLDGWELCRILRGSDGARRERLLLISADPSACNASEFLRESKFVCLTKPFLLSELKRKVAHLIGCRTELAEPGPGQAIWRSC
jgi:two-component system NtrC family sensor kinase